MGDKDKCQKTCEDTSGCVAFDFTENGNSDACRGVSKIGSPRYGGGGADKRQFCILGGRSGKGQDKKKYTKKDKDKKGDKKKRSGQDKKKYKKKDKDKKGASSSDESSSSLDESSSSLDESAKKGKGKGGKGKGKGKGCRC